jgi:transposase
MLEALIAGERDPQVLAQMAKGRMRTKITPLTQALVGRFGQHHAFLCRMHLDRLDALDGDIAKLSTRIEAALEPFRDTLARLDTIPGVGPDVAEVIIAETGADMSRFPTPGHLASWAGVAPGLNQSGERNKPAHTRHGDHWLTGALGVAAMAANPTKDTTFLGARYRRLARRIGKLKALVAIEHSILTAVWHVLSENTDYHDLGGDYHAKRDPQRALRRITRDANRLGYTVRFDPIQAA